MKKLPGQAFRCALAVTVAVATLPVHAGLLDTIRESGEITLAHRDAAIPMSYLDGDQRPVGYAMDLCLKVVAAIRQELKLKDLVVRYLLVTPATRLSAVADGKAAMECGSTTNNAERRKIVDYTIAHFITSARFLVRSDSGITKMADLAGRPVVSTTGTTNLKTLRRLDAEYNYRMKVVEAKDHNEAFGMVAAGKADAYAMDDVLLYGLRANAPDPSKFSVVGKPMTIEPYAIVLPKGDAAFKKVVDKEMRRIILSGEITAIYAKWFQQPIPPRGINMELPMPYVLKDSFKYPSDKVADLEN